MEDCGMLASDCIVLSCCFQCIILQIIIFIFIRLPCKVVQKAKQYVRRKLQKRRKHKRIESINNRFRDDMVEIHEWSIKIPEVFPGEDRGSDSCMEEVERVLWELSQKGQFAFGSFWGREATGVPSMDIVVARQQSDSTHVVQIELVEIVTSFRHSY